MSRFARLYEDPDYDDDMSWEDDEADWEDYQADLHYTAVSLTPVKEELSPYSTINS